MPFNNLKSDVTNEEVRENDTYSRPYGKKKRAMVDIFQHI
jgi:hypothetical protein